METILEQHVLQRAGCPIHYWISAPEDRPLVVFTHGAGADHRMFDSQVAALAGKYGLLTWDVRGHGMSRPIGERFTIREVAADLLAILDEAGRDKAIFVGQSMGGNVVQELVFLHSERVQVLVIVDCACNTFRLTLYEKLGLAAAPAMLRLYPYETLKRQSAQASSIKPAVRDYLYQAFSRIPKDEFVQILQSTTECLHFEPGYRITQPLLLTVGEFDSTGNIKKVVPLWAAREPNCRYTVIPDAGHCANMDNPEFFNRLLGEFLDENT